MSNYTPPAPNSSPSAFNPFSNATNSAANTNVTAAQTSFGSQNSVNESNNEAQNQSGNPLKRLGGKKLPFNYIFGGLAILLLIVGGAVGFYLTQMNQDVRQQASTGTYACWEVSGNACVSRMGTACNNTSRFTKITDCEAKLPPKNNLCWIVSNGSCVQQERPGGQACSGTWYSSREACTPNIPCGALNQTPCVSQSGDRSCKSGWVLNSQGTLCITPPTATVTPVPPTPTPAATPRPNGAACSANNQCQSNSCVSGRCVMPTSNNKVTIKVWELE